MSNRFEKAINLKKNQIENINGKTTEKSNEVNNGNINVKSTEELNGNISVKSIENINVKNNENSSLKSISLKEKLKNIDNNKTQITINLKNENLKKLEELAKETGKSRAYIVDYLLENYL